MEKRRGGPDTHDWAEEYKGEEYLHCIFSAGVMVKVHPRVPQQDDTTARRIDFITHGAHNIAGTLVPLSDDIRVLSWHGWQGLRLALEAGCHHV